MRKNKKVKYHRKINILVLCRLKDRSIPFKLQKPFVYEQIETILKSSSLVQYKYLFIYGKSLSSYFKAIIQINIMIRRFSIDLIHAHYGLSGLIGLFQFKIPLIVTYHGSDINQMNIRLISFMVHLFSAKSIFVSDKLSKKVIFKKNKKVIIPCGVSFSDFKPLIKNLSKERLGLDINRKYVLFSSSFQNRVKNYPLAKRAFNELSDCYQLIELKNYSREQVNLLLNAVDLLLLTSFSEGSPQITKEALACNTPIVSVDVGDVKEQFENVDGCEIVDYDHKILKSKIIELAQFGKTNSRAFIERYDNDVIARRIIDIYIEVLIRKNKYHYS